MHICNTRKQGQENKDKALMSYMLVIVYKNAPSLLLKIINKKILRAVPYCIRSESELAFQMFWMRTEFESYRNAFNKSYYGCFRPTFLWFRYCTVFRNPLQTSIILYPGEGPPAATGRAQDPRAEPQRGVHQQHHHQLLPGRGHHAQGYRRARSAYGKDILWHLSVVSLTSHEGNY